MLTVTSGLVTRPHLCPIWYAGNVNDLTSVPRHTPSFLYESLRPSASPASMNSNRV